MDRDLLLARTRERIDRYVEDDDAQSVLDLAALADAEALLEIATEATGTGGLGIVDGEAWQVAGWLYWFRFNLLPKGEDEIDRQIALMVFGVLYPRFPEAVPSRVRDYFASGGTVEQAIGPGWPQAVEELQTAFATTGDPRALAGVIALLRGALPHARKDDSHRTALLNDLGNALFARFEISDDLADLNEAIEVCGPAMRAVPQDDPARPMMLSNLGNWLRLRFVRLGQGADVDEAVALSRTATAVPDGYPRKAAMLSSLNTALHIRFDQRGHLADLEEAITAGRAALAQADDTDRPLCQSNLAGSLWARFRRLGSVADLDESIDLCRQAMWELPPDHPGQAVLMANFAVASFARFGHVGDQVELDTAIDTLERALASAEAGRPDRPWWLASIAWARLERFGRSGRPEDLEGAIAAMREGARSVPEDHPYLPRMLNDLGAALETRFSWWREKNDLDEAVSVVRRAASLATDAQPAGWYTVGKVLLTGHRHHPDTVDVTEAVDAMHKALHDLPVDHPTRPDVLNGLSTALEYRFRLREDPSDLDEAIRTERMALDATGEEHPAWAMYLSNLGSLLGRRFARLGAAADLDEAITNGTLSVRATPEGHAALSTRLTNLGASLRARYRERGQRGDGEEALAVFRQASAKRETSAHSRIGAASAWGSVAAELGLVTEAADGFATALGLLPDVAWRGLGRSSQETQLGGWGGLAAEAGASALAADRPGEAVRSIDQGRGVLWTQLLETRTDLSRLKAEAPALAARLDEVRAILDSERDDQLSTG